DPAAADRDRAPRAHGPRHALDHVDRVPAGRRGARVFRHRGAAVVAAEPRRAARAAARARDDRSEPRPARGRARLRAQPERRERDKSAELLAAILKDARLAPRHFRRSQAEWIAVAERENAAIK